MHSAEHCLVPVTESQCPWADHESRLESVSMCGKNSAPSWEMSRLNTCIGCSRTLRKTPQEPGVQPEAHCLRMYWGLSHTPLSPPTLCLPLPARYRVLSPDPGEKASSVPRCLCSSYLLPLSPFIPSLQSQCWEQRGDQYTPDLLVVGLQETPLRKWDSDIHLLSPWPPQCWATCISSSISPKEGMVWVRGAGSLVSTLLTPLVLRTRASADPGLQEL